MNASEELNRAKAVVRTAKEHHIWEPTPETDEEFLEQAKEIVDQANYAWQELNIRGPAVQAVRFAYQVAGATEGEEIVEKNKGTILDPDIFHPDDHTVNEVQIHVEELAETSDLKEIARIYEEEKSGKNRKTLIRFLDNYLVDGVPDDLPNEELDEGLDRQLDQDEERVTIVVNTEVDDKKSKFDESFEANEFAKAQAKKLNLPIPDRVEDLPTPTLDKNVANLTIEELQKRLVDASLCLAAATWQTAIAQIDEEHAKRVGDHYFNKAFRDAVQDAKNKDAAVAEAESQEPVKKWRDKAAEANATYVTYRGLKDVYKGYFDTVSRVFAMKQEERERSRY